MTAASLAFLTGVLALVGVGELAGWAGPWLRVRAPRLARFVAELAEAPLRLGRDGRDPGVRERRRLLAAGALCAFVLGLVLVGPLAGVALGCAGPWVVGRVLAAARERYRRAVDAGAAAIALALADALGGGHSIRGAVAEAAAGLDGPPGAELRRVARELALGAHTEAALDAMRARARSHG